MAEIEKMKAYDDYYLFFFDHVREAINFRLADADTYLADLDKQIKHHTGLCVYYVMAKMTFTFVLR